jgi:DNA-directed RNA polymerase specialized sigma24 family protein
MKHASPEPDHRAIPAPHASAPTPVDAALALYRTHFTSLVRLATLLVDDRDVAVGVVDDAFVQRYRSGEPLTIGRLRTAVVACARGRAPADRRAVQKRPVILDVLATLPHDQRECIVLQHYVALSDDDFVAAVGEPLDVVRARLEQAMRAVAERLEGEVP